MKFEEWLSFIKKSNGKPYSQAAINHYVGGLNTVSREMLELKIIEKPLDTMSISELDYAISKIIANEQFQYKDSKGNAMYSNSLKRFRHFVSMNSEDENTEIEDVKIIRKDTSLTSTEIELLVKARRGQGRFREDLLKKYNKKCIMTDISIPKLLVASHIKPWHSSTNEERLDVNNGLLLSATYDRLFDKGYISFSNQGVLMVSEYVSKRNAEILQIENGLQYDIKFNPQMEPYLKHHNSFVFASERTEE